MEESRAEAGGEPELRGGLHTRWLCSALDSVQFPPLRCGPALASPWKLDAKVAEDTARIPDPGMWEQQEDAQS